MAKTESAMRPLGSIAPYFSLPDSVSGEIIRLDSVRGKLATIVAFICNHCPYVQYINHELPRLAKDFAPLGVTFIAINSNDIAQFPEDAPDRMQIVAAENGYCFPYLFDATQEVARAYDARCTPDFFVFNHQLALVYRGQLDDARIGNTTPVTGHSIRKAVQCLIDKQPIPEPQKPSLGCGIKWRS